MRTLSPAAALLAALLCAAPAAGAEPRGPGLLLDPQIAAFLDLSDLRAHNLAYAEIEHGVDPAVLSFAQLVMTDRLWAARRLGELSIPPAYNDVVLARRREMEAAVGRLRALRLKAVDRAFLAAAAENLASEIEEIDKRFALEASAPVLGAHLRERRFLLEAHLAKARELAGRAGR